MCVPFETVLYSKDLSTWPISGKVILVSHPFGEKDSIIVYQAYKPEIAEWAVKHKTFVGCPQFKLDRMTWIKTNFLWMMYRSGWASKINQERILAISIKTSGFLEILKAAKTKPGTSCEPESDKDNVRLQWDPDHDPFGEKVDRRAIQLGLRGDILYKYLHEWITDILDITPFVEEQREIVNNRD